MLQEDKASKGENERDFAIDFSISSLQVAILKYI